MSVERRPEHRRTVPWVRLQLLHQEAIDFVLSFPFVGPVAGFAMACTAFVNVRQSSGDERVPSTGRITPAGDG